MFVSKIRLGIGVFIIVAELAGTPSLAQDVASSIPPSSCQAPNLIDRISIPQEDLAHLKGQAQAFETCTQEYVAARQASLTAAEAKAKAEADAANNAVRDANAFMAKFKVFLDRHSHDR